MAISNNNTGLRPGVCTSSTRPTSPYNGQVIYETDTTNLYVWNGSAWVAPSLVSPSLTGVPTAPTATAGTNTTQVATTAFANTAGGLALITPTSVDGTGVSLSGQTVSFSGSSSISVNGCFSSSYLNYRVEFNVTGSNASTTILLRVRKNGSDHVGSYSSVGPYYYLSAGTGYSTITASQAVSYFLIGGTPGSSGVGGGHIEFFGPKAPTTTTVQYCSGINIANTGAEWYSGMGIHYATYDPDGFSIIGNSGYTLTGSLKVYGYR